MLPDITLYDGSWHMSVCGSKNTHSSDRYLHLMSHVLFSLQVLPPHMYMSHRVGIAEPTDVLVCNGAMEPVVICCQLFFTFFGLNYCKHTVADQVSLITLATQIWEQLESYNILPGFLYLLHWVGITWASMHYQSLAIRLFFQQFVWNKSKESIEVLHYCPSQRTSYV